MLCHVAIMLHFLTGPFYIATSHARAFRFLHVLINSWCFPFSSCVKWHLIVVVIFISLVTNGVEHLFMDLLATIYVSSLENVYASLLSILSLGWLSFSSILSFLPHSSSLLLLSHSSLIAAVTPCRGGGAQTCKWPGLGGMPPLWTLEQAASTLRASVSSSTQWEPERLPPAWALKIGSNLQKCLSSTGTPPANSEALHWLGFYSCSSV